MASGSKRRHSESSDDDEQIEKNFKLLRIVKNKAITLAEEKIQKITDALANGANVNFQDLYQFKRTALYYAVQNGEIDIVDHLLLNKARVITEEKKANPLECAEKLKEKTLLGSPEEKKYLEIIEKIKKYISKNDPQPSTSTSQTLNTSAPTLTNDDSEKQKRKFSGSQEDVANKKPKETYEASGLKSTLHGNVYQLKLLMLFVKRCRSAKYEFRLATEMDAAEKFDDAVLEFTNSENKTTHYVFLQAKHIQIENETIRKIKVNDLQTTSDDNFSLQKYFKSYQNIQKNDKFEKQSQKHFIIYTNIDFEKELAPFHFEQRDAKINNFDMQADDGVKKSNFYKLVGSNHTDEGEKVLNQLTTLFGQTTDFHKLGEELLEHLIKKKTIGFTPPLFKEYRDFLVQEVIDIHYNKLRKEFINLDYTLSAEAKYFHKILLEILEKPLNAKSKKEQSKNNDDSSNKKQKLTVDLLNEIGKIEFQTSADYKKVLIIEKNPMLNDLVSLANEIFCLIKKKADNKIILIRKSETSKKSLIPEIYKLAGHVLVKDENDEKITTFRNSFLKNNKNNLPGNLEAFRTELEKHLKNAKINFDELKKYTFIITDFVTCKENDVTRLIDTKPNYPPQDVTREEIEDFIESLIFAVNQPNEEKLGEIINKEIGEEFNLLDSELATHDFTKRMLDWFKAKKGTYLDNHEADEFFNDIQKLISQLVVIGPTSLHVKKLENRKIVFEFKALPVSLLNFLNQSNDILSIKFCHIETSKTSLLIGSLKVIQALKEQTKSYSRDDSFISLDLNTLLLISDRVLNAFKRDGTRLLIVECNYTENIDKILNELKIHLKISNQKRLVLIGPADNVFIMKFCDDLGTPLKIDDESAFNELTEKSQKHVLEDTCIFQKKKVVLNQLFDEKQKNLTDSINLAKLLDSENKFEIGNEITSFDGYKENYFIERIFLQEPEKDSDDPHTVYDPDTISFFQKTFSQLFRNPQKLEKNPELEFMNEINIFPKFFKFLLKSKKIKKTIKDLLKQLKPNALKNFIIISDVAGMGKSTILAHLSQEIKEQYKDHWIVQIELSKYTCELKTLTLSETLTPKSAIDFISEKILNLQTPFETELLEYLFKKKKVVLLLDAFDEISPNYERKVIELLEALKRTDNQIWVTTRPHLKESLEKNQKDRPVFYNLEPFSENDQVKFLTNFWSDKLKLGDKKNEKKINKYAEELLKKLTRSIRDNEFTGIPLQTRMLAEAFEDGVSTFHNDSTGNMPAFIHQFNILELYEKFYNVKHDTVSQKGDVVKDDMHKVLQKYGRNIMYSHLALLMLFPEHEGIFGIDKQELLSLPIARFGIAEISEKSKEIQFIHQTFAEYSAAKYFSEALTKHKPKEVCNFFFTNILLDDNCQTIRYFIDCFLKTNSISEEYSNEYGKQIDKLLKDKTYKKKNKTILHVAAKEGHLYIFNFLTKSLKDKYIQALKLLLEERYNNQLAWHDAASEGHIEVLKVIWEWTKYFNVDPKTMLQDAGKLDNTAWIQASQNHHFDVLIKMWDWVQEIQENQELKTSLLLSKDFLSERNALHSVATDGNTEVLKTLQGWVSQIGADLQNVFLLSKEKSEQNAFHIAAAQGDIEVLTTLRDWAKDIDCDIKHDSLLSKIILGNNTFQLAAFHGHIEVLTMLRNWATEFKCDFKNDLLLSKDNLKHTPFHMATMNGNVEILKILHNWAMETDDCDFKNEIFLLRVVNEYTAFHIAVIQGDVKLLKLFHDWAMETGCDFKNDLLLSKDDKGRNGFHLAAIEGQVEVLTLFRDWARTNDYDFKNEFLLSKPNNGRNGFHLAATEGQVEVLKLFRDWARANECDFTKDLMLSKDNTGLVVFQLAAARGQVEVLKMLRDWAMETECDFKTDMFLSKDNNECTAFHLGAMQGHVEVLKMLQCWATETKCDFQNEFILLKDCNGNTAFHLAAIKGHVEVLKTLRESATETNCDFKNDLLLFKGHIGCTAFHLAAIEGQVEVLKLFRDWATETDCDFKNKFLLSKDNNERNAFHMATTEGKVEVLKLFRDWATETKCDFKNEFLLSKDNNERNAFHMATIEGKVEVLKLFRDWATETKCDFKNEFLLSKDNNERNAFHMATTEGKVEVLKLFRDWATETDCDFKNEFLLSKDNNEHNAFSLAALSGHVDVVNTLLDWTKNTDVRFKKNFLLSKNKNGHNAFHLAVLAGHVDVVNTLLDWATKTDTICKNDFLLSKDSFGHNAFHQALKKGPVEVVNTLLKWATKTDATFKNDLLLTKNRLGENAYHLAAENKNVEILKMLRDWATENDCDFINNLLFSKNFHGHTPFQMAALYDHVEVVKTLLDWSKKTDAICNSDLLLSKDNYGNNVLHLTALAGSVEVAKTLLDWIKKTDATIMKYFLLSKDRDGQTAFHLAVLTSRKENLEILQFWHSEYESGRESDFLLHKNKDGKTAFQEAENNRVEFLKMLRDWATENECDFNNKLLLSKNNAGQTVFNIAVNHSKVSDMLWEWALIAHKTKQSLSTSAKHTS